MKTLAVSFLKYILTQAGSLLNMNSHQKLQLLLNYMKVGRWMKDHDFYFGSRVIKREDVFRSVTCKLKNKKVLYCEFGVFQGASMRIWAKELKNPDTHLHGFDSFEGLPEDFDVYGSYKKGTFDVGGKIPTINDPRVQFFKGWFNDILPTYRPPDHEVLVIIMDADIYSSTIYVLRHFRPIIKKGTYIYFDEMSRPDHEPKAFDEFMRESGLKFRQISSDFGLNRVFFQCIG